MTQAMGIGLEDTKFLLSTVNSRGKCRAQMLMILYDASVFMPLPQTEGSLNTYLWCHVTICNQEAEMKRNFSYGVDT